MLEATDEKTIRKTICVLRTLRDMLNGRDVRFNVMIPGEKILQAIDEALLRIDKGTYGIDEETGEVVYIQKITIEKSKLNEYIETLKVDY